MKCKKIEISGDLVKATTLAGQAENKSAEQQIEAWAKLGRICLENPELPVVFVAEVLEAEEERKQGIMSEYHFGQQQ